MRNGTDLRISARSVSRGIAIGKVVCLYGSQRQFYRIDIDESLVVKETRRFRAAKREIHMAKGSRALFKL